MPLEHVLLVLNNSVNLYNKKIPSVTQKGFLVSERISSSFAIVQNVSLLVYQSLFSRL